MPPESVVLLLLGTWLLVAAAALWGMLRIARRHHTHQAPQRVQRSERRTQPRHAPVRVNG